MAFERLDRSGMMNGPLPNRPDASAMWTRYPEIRPDAEDRWSPATAVVVVFSTSALLWALIAVLTVQLTHLH